ncbi:MAG: hypothetical protein LBV28_01235 [Puniceicoccales bacterium]|jgi:hypothetical protein|nr:hypothetical protein [Puniceicoccales bacterium]
MRYFLLSPAVLFAAALALAPAPAQAADVDAAKTEQVRAQLAKLSADEKKQVAAAAAKIVADASQPAAARIAAIRSLALLQEPTSVETLKKLFADAAVADEARAAIQRIPGPDSVSALLEGLGATKDPKLQAGFLESLGRLQAKSAVLTIKGFIGGPASEAAQRALASIASPDAFAALLTAPASELRSDLVLDAAAKILVCPNCAKAAGPAVLAALRDLSKGSDADAAFSALLLRFRFQDADAAAALKSDNAVERRAASTFLNNSRDVESAAVLEKALASAQGNDLIAIVGAIANRDQKSAAPALLAKAKAETNAAVKSELLKALGQIGGADDVEFFSSLLGEGEIGDAAKAALGQVRGTGVTQAFTKIVADKSVKIETRKALLDIIRRRDLRDAVVGLLPVLNDSEEDIRIGAIKIVEAFANKTQLPALEAAKPTQADTKGRLDAKIEKLKGGK